MKQKGSDVRKRKLLTFINALSIDEIRFLIEISHAEINMRELMKRFDERNEGDNND